jgi:hypothetical protein
VSLAGYEKSDVSAKNLFLMTVVIVIAVILIIVALNEIFISTREDQVYRAVLQPESKELRELRVRETETLNSYKVLDPDAKKYQIPIDRAMELLADEAFQKKLNQGTP